MTLDRIDQNAVSSQRRENGNDKGINGYKNGGTTEGPMNGNTTEDYNDSVENVEGTTQGQKETQANNTEGGVFSPHEIPNKFEWGDNDIQERLQENVSQSREGSPGDEKVKEDTTTNNYDKRPIRMDGSVDPDGKEYVEQPTTEADQQQVDDQIGQEQFDDMVPPPRLDEESPTWYRRIPLFSAGQSTSGPPTPGTPDQDDSTRWRDLKQVLKFGKQRKGSEIQVPQQQQQQQQEQKRQVIDESERQTRMRASNLITSLISGSPAALFAGASFIQDEHGSRRAPLLLSLLGLDVQDISNPRSRNKKYRINLEYGVGPNRVKWFVVKDLRDLIGLHSRLKVVFFQKLSSFRGFKPVELPRFPRNKDTAQDSNTFNDTYLSAQLPPNGELPSQHIRQQLQGNDVIHGQHVQNGGRPRESIDNQSQISTGNTSVSSRRSLRSHLQNFASRISSIGEPSPEDDRAHHEQYARKIETYLKQLILVLSLRPQANRLFQFLELSPLSVLLSYEKGYQGKQGYLIISSSAKALGWRVGHLKYSDIKEMVDRHTNKWFLVRNSYIMYVSDIYSTTPLEVFLVDPSFKISYSGEEKDIEREHGNSNGNDSLYDENMSLRDEAFEKDTEGNTKISTHLSIKLENGERSMKMLARSEYQLKLWVKSIKTMQNNTIWAKPHRFDSFAPVRHNCFAQWFVDGRDHFWAVSSAMEMAKDVIYIHDWWLSPELYMRRPANGNQEWRLDRILKRKAEQGVKIFVIVYRNVGTTVVTDSLWTKHSLIDLHPNIHVLRSPNQWLQNTYFWAHHEKLCIIDHTVAFVGGIDLCYGRYDTPDHVLVDDSPHDFATKQNANEESIKYQKFPGKDYSNPRVKDFFELDKPYESMYDRESVPRMPWHDVHMVTAGQPAADLGRHFVQRWNYLLRQKRPSRPTPILTPPSEFSPIDLERFNLTGKCEVQLLRSSGNWSLGLKKTEHSIQNAYLKLIETSDHFVYLENQFFVTASAFDGTVIENRIGDALVDRIIRAHNEKKKWKAVIMIPLMPGFESQVDEAEGSAVRVIMQCQYMSISRGSTSIFAKLKKMKINPYDYIQFFSLRKWARIGPNRKIVTEQLYIHGKTMIVDDRVAIIGSANINERSQRGNRDSEVAACVRDTEVVNTTMNGKPYQAGRFSHTLRMRLMREHLGVDVDILEIVERRFNKLEELARKTATGQDSSTNNFNKKENAVASSMVELASRDVLNLPNGTKKWQTFKRQVNGSTMPILDEDYQNIDKDDGKDTLPPHLKEKAHQPAPLFYHSFNNRAGEENSGIRDKKQFSTDSRVSNTSKHKDDIDGKGPDRMESKEYKAYKLSAARTLKRWAKESLVNETTDVFLPNVEQVLEFLDNDDFIADPAKLTAEEEITLADRNQERWNLLKRIAYLQRVAAKQKVQNDDEDAKRLKAGIDTLSNAPARTDKDGKTSSVDKVPKKRAAQDTEMKHMESATGVDARPSAELQEVEELPGDNIPVIQLDSFGVRDVLDGLSDSRKGDDTKINKFIDPYCFADPIDDAFYEDVWFENALRNSRIFREVFHCQPDDAVTTWKEYKDFSRLSTAFGLAQEQEVRRREALYKSMSHSSNSEDDSEAMARVRNEMNRKRSVSANELNENQDDGVLGKGGRQTQNSAVHEREPQEEEEDDYPKRGKSGAYGLRNRLMGDKVFDRETADRLLSEIQGHLVLFPVDWLYKEVESGNWFYNMDRLPPIDIYD